MKQSDLISALEAKTGFTQTMLDEAVKQLGIVVSEALANGDEVTLPGLGKLSTSVRSARTGRNPQTGETIQIAEKRIAKFTVAKALKDKVAG